MRDPISILFVDDEPALLRYVRRALLGDALDVITAGGGREAGEILAYRSVDVLVTDLDMPEMDGLTLLEQMRARYPWMLRALLTGAATLDRALRAINAGEIVRFFPKPFDPDTFKQAVETLAPQIRENRARAARAARADRVADHLRWIEAANPGVTHLELTPSGAVRVALAARLEQAKRAGSCAGTALVLAR